MSLMSSVEVFLLHKGGIARAFVLLLCLSLLFQGETFLGSALYKESPFATPLMHWLNLPALSRTPLVLISSLCGLVGLVYVQYGHLALLGLFGTILFWVMGSINSGFVTASNSFGTHDRLLPLWTLGLLFVYLIFHRKKSTDPFTEAFLLIVPVASALLGAGLSKIMNSGTQWLYPDSLAGVLLFRGFLTGNEFAVSMAQRPGWILSGLSAGALLFQLSSPLLIVFRPRLAISLFVAFFAFNYYVLSLPGFLSYWTPQLAVAFLVYSVPFKESINRDLSSSEFFR